jgi:hypothetical protein
MKSSFTNPRSGRGIATQQFTAGIKSRRIRSPGSGRLHDKVRNLLSSAVRFTDCAVTPDDPSDESLGYFPASTPADLGNATLCA